MGRRQIKELEHELVGMQGGYSLLREIGGDQLLLSAFIGTINKIETARQDLEKLGLYDQCHQALTKARELVLLGEQYDHDAEMLILNANRALMQASGTYDEMSKKLKANPNATVDDFKPDPDAWAMEEKVQNKPV